MLTIGIVAKDCVYLAAPSAGFLLEDASYLSSNMSLYNPPLAKNTLVSYSGETRYLQVIRYWNEIIKEKDMEDGQLSIPYLNNYVLAGIFKSLTESKAVKSSDLCEEIYGTIMVAKGKQLYAIDPDGLSMEAKNYLINQCSGFAEASAIMDCLECIDDPIYKILKVYDKLLITNSAGFYPVVISSTSAPNKFKCYTKEQATKYINNYERMHLL